MNKDYRFHHVISDMIKYRQIKEANVKQCLVSFFYLMKNKELYETLKEDKDLLVLVDSGLYSFSNSVEIDENGAKEYAEKYIEFVKEASKNDNFIGFFELDFDLIGFDYHTFVLPYQKRLLDITNKIVLITQKKRTIKDIETLLEKDVNTIAIPFASSVERNYFDYNYIINKAHEKGKRVHLLGCSTVNYLIHAEQSDSSSWFMGAAMGSEVFIINNKVTSLHYSESDKVAEKYHDRAINNARKYIEIQELVNKKKKESFHEQISLFDFI